MEKMSLTNACSFGNILYIGDEANICINVIEQFNSQLLEIENSNAGWFSRQSFNEKMAGANRLQHFIKYHFEGGIAIFKFKSDNELPQFIKNECLKACKRIAENYITDLTAFA